MAESRTRVLIVNPKLNQAVGIGKAVDAVGGFEAHPFTSSLNALEFARAAPPDLAVLDLHVRSPNVGETTQVLRRLNPKIRLLLTNAPDVAVEKLRADGIIALPARARELEPLLRALFPPDENAPSTPTRRTLEISRVGTDAPGPAVTPAIEGGPDPFQAISDEEPPVPTGIEGGTVREAVRALLPREPLDDSMYVVEITPRPSDTDEAPVVGAGDWRALTPAEELIESSGGDAPADEDAAPEAEAADEAPDGESAEEAVSADGTPEAPADAPVEAPSPDAEPAPPAAATRPRTKKPDKPTLPTSAPPTTPQPPKAAPTAWPIRPIMPAFDDADADLDDDAAPARRVPSGPVPPPRPVGEDTAPQFEPAPERPAETTLPPAAPPLATHERSTEPPAAPEIKIPGVRRPPRKAETPPPAAPAEAAPAPEIKIPGVRRPPRKAETPPPAAPAEAEQRPAAALTPDELRRALLLTHEKIGTTAAALILTQDDEVLAHSGEMPTQEIEELQQVIGGDWDTRGRQARLRYITLPTSRQEYMLHTRRTEGGYALSMAFAGDMAVREIREQSDSVAATLDRMPIAETAGDEEDSAPPAHGSRLPFTAVWMLRDVSDPLTSDIAQGIVVEFDAALRELDWPIHAMNVHADFIYVYCGVQPTYLASEVVAELKRISAEAACDRRPDWSPDELWADAYMALLPGRELSSDEVESFLSFTRSRLRRNEGRPT